MSFIALPGLVGPTLGGWLVEVATWHWVFLINIPVGAVGGVATMLYMQDKPRLVMPRFDLTGYLFLAFGMVSVSLAVDGLSGLGLRQAGVLVLMVFGLASLTAYWLHAAKWPDPLFSPSLFFIPTLRIGLLGNLFSRLGSSCTPFMVPLLLQVRLAYSPFRAGMLVKRITAPLITRYGYRTVLVVNTALVGCSMASFAFITPGQPLWLHIVQLVIFGAVNSMQFTAMNTVTLRELEPGAASSGNSLLSMVQMLAMSMGVAAAGAVLAGFTAFFGSSGAGIELSNGLARETLHAFQATLACMGWITLASAGIFWQLSPEVRAVRKAESTETSGQG